MKKRSRPTTPAPKTLSAATPKRSNRSFSDTSFSSGRVGSCSLNERAIFSKPRPHARQNFCSLEVCDPQFGQYIKALIFPAEILVRERQSNQHQCKSAKSR